MYTYKTEDFSNNLKERTDYIEEVISDYLPKEKVKQKLIIEAMNYSVLAGGKRIRPLLMMETYFAFGGNDIDWISPFMAAIEFIHSYSLVHDDLPAMDNDEYRRGKQTTHVKYGETIGILAGDGLLNHAFETATNAYYDTNDNQCKERTIRSLRVLGDKAGIYGMIGGQVIDTCILEGQKITDQDKNKLVEELNHMYTLKTGALIQASMMIGAILAGASEEQIELVEEMATNIGLAFQIQDDVLDVTSTTEQLGKPVLSDQRNEKITYVALLGLEKAKEEVAFYSEKSLDIYKKLGLSNPFLYDLINMLISRDK